MSHNPFDPNLDGEVNFCEALIGCAISNGIGYFAAESDASLREANLRKLYEEQLANERSENLALSKRIDQLESVSNVQNQPHASRIHSVQSMDLPLFHSLRISSNNRSCSEQKGGQRKMSKFQCELCNGTEFSKSDAGEFVCRKCGVIYSAAQMRQMMPSPLTSDPKAKEDVSDTANVSDGWINEFEELAQLQFSSRDFDSVLSTCNKYKAECEKKGIERFGSLSPLIVYFDNAADSAKSIMSGDYTMSKSLGGSLHIYLDKIRSSEPSDDWFQRIVVPVIGFLELNNELSSLIVERLRWHLDCGDDYDVESITKRSALQTGANSLIEHTNAIALDSLQAIFVSLAKGARLPDMALETIQGLISMLNDGLADVPYVERMILDIKNACWNQIDAIPRLITAKERNTATINAEAHKLWDDGYLTLANQDYAAIIAQAKSDDADKQPEAQFHWHLYKLMQDCLEEDSPLSFDWEVDSQIEHLSAAMDNTSLFEPEQRFEELISFHSHFHNGLGQIVHYLSARERSLQYEEPECATKAHETASRLMVISAAVNEKFLSIAVSLLNSGLNVPSNAFTLFKTSLSFVSNNADFSSTKLASLESQIKDHLLASVLNDQKIANDIVSRKTVLTNSIQSKREALSNAREEISGLNFLQKSRKQLLRDSICSLEEEIKSIDAQLDNVEIDIVNDIWENL